MGALKEENPGHRVGFRLVHSVSWQVLGGGHMARGNRTLVRSTMYHFAT